MSQGTVYLVGAGPGDPGLITRRAARLLRRADVVVHDALVGEDILDLIGPRARRIDVGKRCGGRRTAQERINEILVEAARTARTVVRLKGGDPYVFGRGGEEALELAERGIRFEVVPGVTAGIGVGAYAGIPLTHRDFASSVTFVTGHEDACRGQSRIDWDALARVEGTLVVYMGLGGLELIARRLIRGGRAAGTPAAVVEWGTLARQRTVQGTLATIPGVTAEAGIRAPALVIVGGVVALRESLAWFDRLPLRGRRIVVARSRPQPSRIAHGLRRLGADVREFPALESVPARAGEGLDAAFASLPGCRGILFASPAAVSHWWREARSRGLDSRALSGLTVVSLGGATGRALQRRGIDADVGLRSFVPDSVLAEVRRAGLCPGQEILFPREAHFDSPVAAALREAGFAVREVEVYRTRWRSEVESRDGNALEAADIVVLPSSNATRAVIGAAPAGLGARIVAIGPRTLETALASGLTVHAVASKPTLAGVVDAVLESVAAAQDSTRSPERAPAAVAEV
jgi:uroporphyrinogen III methyltransferase / synthase